MERAAQGAARCIHFGECGGCAIQNLPYEDQLRSKAERVARLLEPRGTKVSKIHPSPQVWFYRNKMEFSFGSPSPREGPKVLLGLKPKGRWDRVMDVRECHLLSPEAPGLLEAVRSWAGKEGLLPYDGRRHTGLLRHLVVREAKNAPERMVLLVTAPGAIPRESFVDAVEGAYPATTLLWGTNGKLSDTAVPDSLEVLKGPGHITEVLRLPGQEMRFRISPMSFFQTNTAGAELLYGILRSWTAEISPKRVLDLYCGGGGISLSLAGVTGEAVGVEQNPASVQDARANAALNGIQNVQFYSGSVETLLPALLDMCPELAVTDPPRAGLHRNVLEALLDWGPKTLVYVSCNPEALARDLELLKARYEVLRAEVVDLFPHTEHVETLVRLSRLAAPRA